MTTRLLVIGLDGATLDLIEPWARAGHLPNLAALIQRGSAGRLQSTLPAMTLPAWSTFLTGCQPGRHGLFDFTRHVPNRYAVQFVNATHRQAPTFLRRLSDAGLRLAALGIPTTYPPEPLNGVVIAGFDSPVTTRRDASFVYPPELHAELHRTTGDFPLTDLQEVRIGPGWHRHALRKLTAAIDGQTRVARHLLDREAWDCFAIVFGSSDTVSHHFWAFHDPGSPRFDAAGAAEFSDAIRTIYQRLDQAVGELLQSAGPDADVFILSDHGFGGASDRAVSINRRLNEAGLFNFKAQPGVASRLAGILKQAGLRLLPSGVQQRIFRRLGRVVDALESGARFGHVDWTQTLAYSEELNYFPSVWINLRGREPGGVVDPGDYEWVRDRVIDALRQWVDEDTGRPIVQHAHRREDVYAGPMLAAAPDIILELALVDGQPTRPDTPRSQPVVRHSPFATLISQLAIRDAQPTPPHSQFVIRNSSYSYAVETARTPGPSLRRLDRSEFIGAKGRSMNGSHRPEGVLIAAGPSIIQGASLDAATLADLAPTLLALLDRPAAGLDGRILSELLVEARPSLAAWPDADAAQRLWLPQPEQTYSIAEAAILAGRLRSLGYIE